MSDFPIKKYITKMEINGLPIQQYEGPIILCRTEAEATAAIEQLRHETLLGFDTETRPAFRKGENYDPSLLQLAGEKAVYLFQIKQCGLQLGLRQILSDPAVIKAGVAIDRDVNELRALGEFHPNGFVELADAAKQAGIKNLGLRGLTALLFSFRISKKEQVSNWARQELSASQIQYAATDAWLGRKIYQCFKKNGFVSL